MEAVVLRVDITAAKPDMELALPLRHPQAPDKYMLMGGYRLTPEVINKMRQMGVRDLWIKYPGLEAIAKFVDPAVLERRASIAGQLKKNLDVMQSQSSARLPYETYVQEMAGLVNDLLTSRAATLFMDEASGANPDLLQHSTNVAYMCLLMGLKLDAYLIKQRKKTPPRYARKVGNLGVGAMLHDIGMLKLEEDVAARYRKTRNTEDPAFRAHARLGYEMVRGQIEPTAAVIVLDHHQHMDGTGFPGKRGPDGRALAAKGESIHVFARICCVADTFDELRHPADHVKLPAVQAIAQLIQPPHIHWFDLNVLKAFLRVVPPYAPGVPIKLSDGRWAVPMEHSADDPCRPRVQIIADPALGVPDKPPSDPPVDVQVVNLRERPNLHVAWAEGVNVSKFNFTVPRELQGDPTSAVAEAPDAVLEAAESIADG
jgi:HD-GYP domain-containing protein (c-di-GMP phosphodiesterase class II)